MNPATTPVVRAAIAGTGSYLPARVLSNADLEKLVDTSNEWIVERTGILERRVAAENESTSTMAIEAGRRACQNANFDPADLDLIIVASATPDYLLPASACLVQDALGAKRAGAFDLEAACSGFLYAASLASGLIASGQQRNILLVGAETLTRLIDYQDRSTCILFGDGAGAALFRPKVEGPGLLYTKLGSDGGQAMMLRVPAGGSKHPPSAETVAQRLHYIQIEGRKVFRFATTTFIELVEDAVLHQHPEIRQHLGRQRAHRARPSPPRGPAEARRRGNPVGLRRRADLGLRRRATVTRQLCSTAPSRPGSC
jgi:3-oxoacyl-[acyl-carrier-protein] synthase-3